MGGGGGEREAPGEDEHCGAVEWEWVQSGVCRAYVVHTWRRYADFVAGAMTTSIRPACCYAQTKLFPLPLTHGRAADLPTPLAILLHPTPPSSCMLLHLIAMVHHRRHWAYLRGEQSKAARQRNRHPDATLRYA